MYQIKDIPLRASFMFYTSIYYESSASSGLGRTYSYLQTSPRQVQLVSNLESAVIRIAQRLPSRMCAPSCTENFRLSFSRSQR